MQIARRVPAMLNERNEVMPLTKEVINARSMWDEMSKEDSFSTRIEFRSSDIPALNKFLEKWKKIFDPTM